MLYHIFASYQEQFGFLRVFNYITFRTMGAILTAMFLSFVIGPYLISKLSHKQVGQQIRNDGPASHLSKAGTPTMGGVLIIFCLIISVLLWAKLNNPYIWSAIFVTTSFGLIGMLDDILKISRRSSQGLRAASKIKLQLLAALLISTFLSMNYLSAFWPFSFFQPWVGTIFPTYDSALYFPFIKEPIYFLGIIYFFFIILVLIGSSNAVNITDGLDGLAIGPIMIAMLTFLILCYASGHVKIAEYLNIPYIAGSGELAIVCGTVFGASLGFLWYNTYPAQVFMGDVGSLSLGGLLGLLAIVTKNEFLLVLIGGIFVLETLSVMIQVSSFKLSGHRVFRMAPLHHHFELKGWAEPKVIVRFWIISIILSLIALSTLKLR